MFHIENIFRILKNKFKKEYTVFIYRILPIIKEFYYHSQTISKIKKFIIWCITIIFLITSTFTYLGFLMLLSDVFYKLGLIYFTNPDNLTIINFFLIIGVVSFILYIWYKGSRYYLIFMLEQIIILNILKRTSSIREILNLTVITEITDVIDITKIL